MVEAVCRPHAAQLVPAEFLAEASLLYECFQIVHFNLSADRSLQSFNDPGSGVVSVPLQQIHLKLDVFIRHAFLLSGVFTT